MSVYEPFCTGVYECWTTKQLEAFVNDLADLRATSRHRAAAAGRGRRLVSRADGGFTTSERLHRHREPGVAAVRRRRRHRSSRTCRHPRSRRRRTARARASSRSGTGCCRCRRRRRHRPSAEDRRSPVVTLLVRSCLPPRSHCAVTRSTVGVATAGVRRRRPAVGVTALGVRVAALGTGLRLVPAALLADTPASCRCRPACCRCRRRRRHRPWRSPCLRGHVIALLDARAGPCGEPRGRCPTRRRRHRGPASPPFPP